MMNYFTSETILISISALVTGVQLYHGIIIVDCLQATMFSLRFASLVDLLLMHKWLLQKDITFLQIIPSKTETEQLNFTFLIKRVVGNLVQYFLLFNKNKQKKYQLRLQEGYAVSIRPAGHHKNPTREFRTLRYTRTRNLNLSLEIHRSCNFLNFEK